jgi:hypothetical protein
MDFIFMLTNHDSTVPDAVAVYESIRATGLRLVGFKDVGASPETLRRLTEEMHEDGRTVFLEVVSTSRDDELQSIEAGLNLGVDVIMGGTNHQDALALIGDAPIRYFPFPGTIVGHPSELRGTIEDIAAQAAELTSLPMVAGLDLLAYRHRTVDPAALTRAVVAASSEPVVVAGSIDGAQRIRDMGDAGAWAFTIGGAIFDCMLPGGPDLAAQIEWTLQQCQ